MEESLITEEKIEEIIVLEDSSSPISKVIIKFSPSAGNDEQPNDLLELSFIIPPHLIEFFTLEHQEYFLKTSLTGEKILEKSIEVWKEQDKDFLGVFGYLEEKNLISREFRKKIAIEYDWLVIKHRPLSASPMYFMGTGLFYTPRVSIDAFTEYGILHPPPVSNDGFTEGMLFSSPSFRFSSYRPLFSSSPRRQERKIDCSSGSKKIPFNELALNGAQKNIIEETLNFPLGDVLELPTGDAIRALQWMIEEEPIPSKEKEFFKKKDVLNSIEQVRKILSHPCPQNGAETHSEKKGLLFLTARNDDQTLENKIPAVTKEAVVFYIKQLVNNKIKELKENLTPQYAKPHT